MNAAMADDPEHWIAETMLAMGHTTLIPSTEDVSDSVWVVEEFAPGGAAGYYVKRHIPTRHRIVRDGRAVRLDFWKNETQYRIRCGHAPTERENITAVRDVMRTLVDWIDKGIVTWDEAFAGFAIDTSDGSEWWRVLRVAPDATRDEIDAAYKRLAVDAHPDGGGTQEAFIRLREAYTRACVINGE